MIASLISPSGKVLVRRARCSTQPTPDPLAMPVLISLPSEPEGSTGAAHAHGAQGACIHETDLEADLAR
jgi:hypothetical protein